MTLRLAALAALVALASASQLSCPTTQCCTCTNMASGPKACTAVLLDTGSKIINKQNTQQCNGNEFDQVNGIFKGSIYLYNDADNATSLDLTGVKSVEGGIVVYSVSRGVPMHINAPDLVNITYQLNIHNNDKLINISFPKLERVGTDLNLQSNSLTHAAFPALKTVGGLFRIQQMKWVNKTDYTLDLGHFNASNDFMCQYNDQMSVSVAKCVSSPKEFVAAFTKVGLATNIYNCDVKASNATALKCPAPPSPPNPPPPPTPPPPPAVSKEFYLSISGYSGNDATLKSQIGRAVLNSTDSYSSGEAVTIASSKTVVKMVITVASEPDKDAVIKKVSQAAGGFPQNQFTVSFAAGRRLLASTMTVLWTTTSYSTDYVDKNMKSKITDAGKEYGTLVSATTMREMTVKINVPAGKSTDVDALLADSAKLGAALKTKGYVGEVADLKSGAAYTAMQAVPPPPPYDASTPPTTPADSGAAMTSSVLAVLFAAALAVLA